MVAFCQVWLTCKDEAEASKIADALLENRLIACAKQFPVRSQFRWKGNKDNDNEIMLMMDSREDLFEEIESVVKELHSYDTPNLTSTRIIKISKVTERWLKQETK